VDCTWSRSTGLSILATRVGFRVLFWCGFRIRFGFLQLAFSSGYMRRVFALLLRSILNRSVGSIVGSSTVSLFWRILRLFYVDSRFGFSDQFSTTVTLLLWIRFSPFCPKDVSKLSNLVKSFASQFLSLYLCSYILVYVDSALEHRSCWLARWWIPLWAQHLIVLVLWLRHMNVHFTQGPSRLINHLITYKPFNLSSCSKLFNVVHWLFEVIDDRMRKCLQLCSSLIACNYLRLHY